MNKIFVTGNLTATPIISSTNSGTSVTKFGVAVKRPYSKKEETDFFNVTAWGNVAEFCCKYFEKGRRIFIEGRLQTRKYTDKNGVDKIGYEIIADNIEFGDSKKKSLHEDDGKPEVIDESDLPF